MMRRRVPRSCAAVVFATMLLGACGDDSEPPTTTTGTQLANPASVFCVEQGGTVEIVDEAGGQVGYCNLPDGTRIEEWEYFRSHSDSTADSSPD